MKGGDIVKISEMIREAKKVCEKKKSFRLAADIPTFIDYENTDNVFVIKRIVKHAIQ